ncbi:MAG: hypothetical protein HY657_12340 [Acidobacteria bacterium]|nr:hypothetical protein [Acidobacteriota bacterium]
MARARIGWLATLLVAILLPADTLAQGRGRGGGADRDRGPAFCRSGAGHPVFGWEWCEQRGWGRGRGPLPRTSPDVRRYPAPVPFPDRFPSRRYSDVAFDNGYADGYEKGLDDGRDGRAYDPVRHRWYREGDRRYDSRYGSRAQYQNIYRDGFRRGYEAGYRDGDRYGAERRDSFRLPWPF